ncbi:unnamed protein product [Mytilus edulis]|uniref:TTF-type domain-containing protein n=1 Tax=Mytilus edulis TaxID=6550 RepID=A0A8S3QI07_MYTED|nr:unnamed protein product [Mytilus edulis]
MKYRLYCQREPHISFKFPSKTYTDKRRKSGNFKRSCVREWFSVFNFISYSVSQDGLYCLPCRLFPDSSHRRPIKLIREPYRDWKHAKEDMKMHATTDYHQSSMAKLEAFRTAHLEPSSRIDATLTSGNQEIIQRNRQILMSIIKSLVFCGRQGIALRGHRDDDTDKGSSTNKGNFKELLNFRVDAGDSILEKHLNSCKKNATYTSKTSQNHLLLCLKNYIQNKIVSEVRALDIGPYYGIQCDEVTDSSNWEQLGLVIRYTVHGHPKERLLEFKECETITGVEIASKLIESLSNAGLDTQLCRSQTMDGTGNMSGKYNGCAAKFREHSPKAVYYYCSSHDWNLVLCKSSKVKEIHIMLDALKQLGIFFRYSPKRCRRLEKCITDVNNTREEDSKIKSAKFKIFCETRWVEKFTTIQLLIVYQQSVQKEDGIPKPLQSHRDF